MTEENKVLEQQPCEDCISRAETVQFLINHSNDFEDVKKVNNKKIIFIIILLILSIFITVFGIIY